MQACHFHCVRLWKLDAQKAAASGEIGQIILSLLMKGADEALAEYAIAQVMQHTDLPHQKELLSIVAIFAERVMAPERVLSLIGRKDMMESTIVNTLIEEVSAERVAQARAEMARRQRELEQQLEQAQRQRELEQAQRQRELEQAQRQRELEQAQRQRELEQAQRQRELEQQERQREQEHLQHTLIDAVAARFPEAPISLNRDIWQVTETVRLQDLFLELVKAGDLAEFVAVLKTYAASADQS